MLKRFLFLMVLVFLALLIPTGARAQCPPGAYGPGCSSSSGSGITQVASLPTTCTPATSGPVQLTTSPYGIYYCSATNVYSQPTQFGANTIVDATQPPYNVAPGHIITDA